MMIECGTLVKLDVDYKEYLIDVIKQQSVANPEFYESFLNDGPYVFLVEIVQMAGHSIVVGKSGRIYRGFHTEDFCILTEDEV